MTSAPLFLVGAGFGRDAKATVGSIRRRALFDGEYEVDCGYPVLSDLPGICFPEATPRVKPDEIENRLSESILGGELAPLRRLCMELQKADWYLGSALFGGVNGNPYRSLIDDFPSSSYLTFNYDALVEFGLYRTGRWSPLDGYGVAVAAEVGFTAEPFHVAESSCFVLHLHGSLLVYTRDHSFGASDEHGIRWLEQHAPPDFMFDPYTLGTLFYPFSRIMGGLALRSEPR